MVSEKKQTKMALIPIWMIVLTTAFVMLLIPIVDYNEYNEVQNIAVGVVRASTDEYEKYADNRSIMINEIYDSFDKDSVSASMATKAYQNTLYAVLSDLNYSTVYVYHDDGLYYFRYTGLFEYCFSKQSLSVCILISVVLIVLAMAVTLFCSITKRQELRIEGDTITCRMSSGKILQFYAKDIKSVETSGMKGLKIKGDGICYKIILLKNVVELKNKLMELISEDSTRSVNTSLTQTDAMDALKKAKELLDAGVITEEEFAEKKKQLLGL